MLMRRDINHSRPTPTTARDDFFTVFRSSRNSGKPTNVRDISSGAGVTILGNYNKNIIDAMTKQMNSYCFAHAGQWEPGIVRDAANVLVSMCGFDGGGVSFYSGGSEAVEAACKLAAAINVAKHGCASTLLSHDRSYHGNTALALRMSGHPRTKHMNMFTDYANAPIAHRFSDTIELEAQLKQISPNIGIVVIEPIPGTAAFVSPHKPAFLAKVRQLCNEYNAILIHDEIFSGNFRTGHFLASQYYERICGSDVRPDIAVVGKGISGGYFPISAVVTSGPVMQTMQKFSVSPPHTSTNQNHPVGAAAVIAAFYEFAAYKRRIKALIAQMEPVMKSIERLKGIIKVDGVGLLWGIVCKGEPEQIRQHLFDAGYTAYLSSADNGNVTPLTFILVAPPCVMKLSCIAEFGDVLAAMLRDTETEPAIAD